MEQPIDAFRWLTISDFHCGMSFQAALWPQLRHQFYEDLDRLHEVAGPWNVVFFCGDLTQTGAREQFERVDEIIAELFDRLRSLGSRHIRLAPTAGNHDLVRPDAMRPAVRVLRGWHEDGPLRDEFWRNPQSECRQVVDEAFRNYTEWLSYCSVPLLDEFKPGILPGDMSARIRIGPHMVGIVGLNSTFLQLEGGDYKGRLAVSPEQFHAVCGGNGPDWVAQCSASLLMTHQPPDWLHPTSLREFNAEIAYPGRFAVHQFGHEHENIGMVQGIGAVPPRSMLQVSSLFGLETYETTERRQIARKHGYFAGVIEFGAENAALRIFPRSTVTQVDGTRHVVPDFQAYPRLELDQGTHRIALPINPPADLGDQHIISAVRSGGPETTLVAIGPGIVAEGFVEGSDRNVWTIRLTRLVFGDEMAFGEFEERFEKLPSCERYVILNAFGEGRVIQEPKGWRRDGSTFVFRCAVEPRFPRKDAQTLKTDLDLHNMSQSISGPARVPQILEMGLGVRKGVKWTPLSRPRNGDPSLLSHQCPVMPAPR